MADIIRLEQYFKKTSSERLPSEQSASIIIFPGVRYERPYDGGSDHTATGGRRPRKAN